MELQLYDYQQAALDAIRAAFRAKKRAPLLVSPTGSGKTRMFAAITKGAAERGNRVWILVHRDELVDQVSSALRDIGVDHALVTPEYRVVSDKPVQVASVFTLVRRLDWMAPPSLIVIDEAHHATLASTWGRIIGHYRRARVLGVTATPTRLSGEGLGDIFDALILGPSVQQLIDSRRLAPLRLFAPPTIDLRGLRSTMGDWRKADLEVRVNKPQVVGDAIDHYKRLTPGQRAAVFTVSVASADAIATDARKAGISAVMMDATMDKSLRREVVRDFQAGKIQWLVTVDLISEGFDCPGIEVGISLRPTQSLGLWLQQCGRCLRIAPGKTHATILDHAGNALMHGLPTEDREWTLAGTKRNIKPGERAQSVRVCPACFSANRSGALKCTNCGAAFPVEGRKVASKKGELKELRAEDRERIREREKVGMARDKQALIELGTARGYKDPAKWAEHVLDGRRQKRVSA